MMDLQPLHNFDRRTLEELKTAFGDYVRSFERMLHLLEYVRDTGSPPNKQIPCHNCPKRKKCSEPCDRLEAQLPGIYAGRIHGEGTTSLNLDETRDDHGFSNDWEEENMKNLDLGKLRNIQKVHPLDPFIHYEACWHIFTKKQQEVLKLFYRDGKNKTQIAKRLNKAISTIHGRLARAEKKKQQYFRKKF